MLHKTPFQTPQIKAATAAMCIEFRPFLRVSCSYQGSDKLISQAFYWATNRTLTPTKADFNRFFLCFHLEENTRQKFQYCLDISKSNICCKIKYLALRSGRQTRQPWHSWWGVYTVHSPQSGWTFLCQVVCETIWLNIWLQSDICLDLGRSHVGENNSS